MAKEIAGAAADAGSRAALNVAFATTQGFKFAIKIEENWVAGVAIAVAGVVSLGGFYTIYKVKCNNAVRRALPEAENTAESSILVEMHVIQHRVSCHSWMTFKQGK